MVEQSLGQELPVPNSDRDSYIRKHIKRAPGFQGTLVTYLRFKQGRSFFMLGFGENSSQKVEVTLSRCVAHARLLTTVYLPL